MTEERAPWLAQRMLSSIYGLALCIGVALWLGRTGRRVSVAFWVDVATLLVALEILALAEYMLRRRVASPPSAGNGNECPR